MAVVVTMLMPMASLFRQCLVVCLFFFFCEGLRKQHFTGLECEKEKKRNHGYVYAIFEFPFFRRQDSGGENKMFYSLNCNVFFFLVCLRIACLFTL